MPHLWWKTVRKEKEPSDESVRCMCLSMIRTLSTLPARVSRWALVACLALLIASAIVLCIVSWTVALLGYMFVRGFARSTRLARPTIMALRKISHTLFHSFPGLGTRQDARRIAQREPS